VEGMQIQEILEQSMIVYD